MLDKSWNLRYWEETINDLDFDESSKNVAGIAYAFGAEDFQKKAIEKFNKEISIFSKGNTEEARITTKVFKSVVEILQNLKCE